MGKKMCKYQRFGVQKWLEHRYFTVFRAFHVFLKLQKPCKYQHDVRSTSETANHHLISCRKCRKINRNNRFGPRRPERPFWNPTRNLSLIQFWVLLLLLVAAGAAAAAALELLLPLLLPVRFCSKISRDSSRMGKHQWRTEKHQNRAQKLPNVTSETYRKEWF